MLKKIVKYWLPAVIWGALIFSVSNGSVPSLSPVYWQDFIVHKSGHILEYGLLAILVYRALKQEKISQKEAVVYTIIICFFYGVTDEFHQSFTPTREPRIRDVFIDIIGASGGLYIVWKLLPQVPVKLRKLAEKLDLL